MHRALQVLVIVGCVALACDTTWAQGRSARTASKKQAEPDFLPGYKYREILGFKLLVNNQVLEENERSEDNRKPLEVLELELGMLARELPPRAVNVLRNEIGFWVEWDKVLEVGPNSPKGGRAVACYRPGDNKLHRYAFRSVESKVKSNAVEILSMKLLTAEHQGTRHRSVLLHEITHAVHHHLFDYDNPHIIAAYRNAMANDLYKGQYASTDPMEYFAEVTCAYFGHLHYQPHNRDELKEYDPRGYDMMAKVWGTPEAIAAEVKVGMEKEAAPKLANARRLLLAKAKAAEGKESLESIIKDYPGTKAAADAQKLLDRTANPKSTANAAKK
jgi:hypothetical protein